MKRTKDCGITNLVQKVRRDQSIEGINQPGYLETKEKVGTPSFYTRYMYVCMYVGKCHENIRNI